MTKRDKWTNRFLSLAQFISTWSKDPSTQVGCVIADPLNRVVSLGYNGYPRGVEDNYDVPRELKLAQTIHAEQNALLNSTRSVEGCSLYVTHIPCVNCAKIIAEARLKEVFFPTPHPDFVARWGDTSISMLLSEGVAVHQCN